MVQILLAFMFLLSSDGENLSENASDVKDKCLQDEQISNNDDVTSQVAKKPRFQAPIVNNKIFSDKPTNILKRDIENTG